jgi:hypothetical protein
VKLRPISLRAANAFIEQHHRHHPGVRGWLFGVSVIDDGGQVVGVAVVGRPVARALQDGVTCEVTRVCTTGYKHAASMLYGACARAASALGYTRVLTYLLQDEAGVSLTAAGWQLDLFEAGGGSWDRPSRPRTDKAPTGRKQRWRAA